MRRLQLLDARIQLPDARFHHLQLLPKPKRFL
jgi:hypothetical protein